MTANDGIEIYKLFNDMKKKSFPWKNEMNFFLLMDSFMQMDIFYA